MSIRRTFSAVAALSAVTSALASPHIPRDHHALAKRMEGTVEKRGTFTGGRMTWYGLDTGADACTGKTHKASDYIVALNMPLFGESGNGHCGKQVHITYNGKSAVATVEDACASCPESNQLDMTEGLFTFFASPDVGVFYADWYFLDDAPEPTTSTHKATPTSTTHKTTSTPKPAPTTTEKPKTTFTKAKPTTTFSKKPVPTPTTTKEPVQITTSTRKTHKPTTHTTNTPIYTPTTTFEPEPTTTSKPKPKPTTTSESKPTTTSEPKPTTTSTEETVEPSSSSSSEISFSSVVPTPSSSVDVVSSVQSAYTVAVPSSSSVDDAAAYTSSAVVVNAGADPSPASDASDASATAASDNASTADIQGAAGQNGPLSGGSSSRFSTSFAAVGLTALFVVVQVL